MFCLLLIILLGAVGRRSLGEGGESRDWLSPPFRLGLLIWALSLREAGFHHSEEWPLRGVSSAPSFGVYFKAA